MRKAYQTEVPLLCKTSTHQWRFLVNATMSSSKFSNWKYTNQLMCLSHHQQACEKFPPHSETVCMCNMLYDMRSVATVITGTVQALCEMCLGLWWGVLRCGSFSANLKKCTTRTEPRRICTEASLKKNSMPNYNRTWTSKLLWGH